MSTSMTRHIELAHRTNDGVDVYLFWNESTSRVTVDVVDERTEHSFELEVDGRHALDAFNHPYAYAALRRHNPQRPCRPQRRLARRGPRFAGSNHQPKEERPCTHGSITREQPFPAP